MNRSLVFFFFFGLNFISGMTASAQMVAEEGDGIYKSLMTKETFENLDFPFPDKKHEFFEVIECEQAYIFPISNAYEPNNDFVKTCIYQNEFLIEYDNSINNGMIRNNDISLFSADLEISMCGPDMLIVFSFENPKSEYYFQYYDTHWGAALRESGFSHSRPYIGEVTRELPGTKKKVIGCGLKGVETTTAP